MNNIISLDFKKKTLGFSSLHIAYSLLSESKIEISHLKLQKLIYIAEGCCLALTNHKLIKESFSVGNYGPINDSVFNEFKEFGNHPILRIKPEFIIEDEPTLNLLKKILNDFSRLSVITLSMMCNNEYSPWFFSKENKLNRIPDYQVKDYFLKNHIK